MVRSRNVRILVVESFILKKRECKRDEEKKVTHKGVLKEGRQHS
jgi:hypothetical protein